MMMMNNCTLESSLRVHLRRRNLHDIALRMAVRAIIHQVIALLRDANRYMKM